MSFNYKCVFHSSKHPHLDERPPKAIHSQSGTPPWTLRLANSLALTLKVRTSIGQCTRIVEYALSELEIAICNALWCSFGDAEVLRSHAESRQEREGVSASGTSLAAITQQVQPRSAARL